MFVMSIEIECKRFDHWNCHIVELVIDVHIDAVVSDFNALIYSIQLFLQFEYVLVHSMK